MHALVIDNGTLRWQERDQPTPGPGQLLVRVASAGINGADLLQLRGLYPAPEGVPEDIPGLEFAGTVVERGHGSTRFAVGDHVMGLVGGGAQAEMVVADEHSTVGVPDGTDMGTAGGFMEAYVTAFDAVFVQAEAKIGETLLINGAAGGVGIAAIRLALAAGLRVVGTVRTAATTDRITTMFPGAPLRVVEAGSLDGDDAYADICLELVGASNLRTDIKSLRRGGRIVLIGAGSGAKTELNILQLMGKRGRIHGSTLRSQSAQERSALIASFTHSVLPLFEDGRLPVTIEQSFAVADGVAAYELFRNGGKIGKIVLVSQ